MIVSVRRALIIATVSSFISFSACTGKKAEEPVASSPAAEEVPSAPAAPEAPEAPVTLDGAAPAKKPAKSKKKAAKKAKKADQQ